MDSSEIRTAIQSAMAAAGLSQHAIAAETGISQPTLSRILSGQRPAKMPEIIRIAEATGWTVGQLTGTAPSDRAQYSARATDGSDMARMRQMLQHFINLDAYLEDQAIPAVR